MELITTYPAAVNSKATVTMGVLDQATTIVEVLDATVLPEAPNLLVLGTDQTAETVLMTARENNTLTVQRAVQGIAKSWPAGTQIARNFTGKDWDDMRSNVEAIVTKILGLTASDVGAVPLNDIGGVHNLKTYYEFKTIGITNGSETIDSIMSAIPSGSLFIAGITSASANIYPMTGGGTLFVEKSYSDRAKFTYWYGNTNVNKQIWIGLHNAGYWSGWIELADASKFLPLDGSVPMSGNLLIGDNVNYIKRKNKTSIPINLCCGTSYNDNPSINLYPTDYVDTPVAGAFVLRSGANAHKLKGMPDGNLLWDEKKLFGEHNKPSGSYTGNGSATSRTIDIGGIGYVLRIINHTYITFVWGRGGFTINSADGTITKYSESELAFKDGVLTLATTNGKVNYNGSIYIYKVD